MALLLVAVRAAEEAADPDGFSPKGASRLAIRGVTAGTGCPPLAVYLVQRYQAAAGGSLVCPICRPRIYLGGLSLAALQAWLP
jgi:hypothetical protein